MRTPETIHDAIMRHLPTVIALRRSMTAAAKRVDVCVTPDEHAGPLSHSRFLERLNEEHRAAIEHARLYTQLMSWRDAMIEQDAASPRLLPAAEHTRAESCRPCDTRPDVPRIGEVSPVVEPVMKREISLIDRVRAFTGRVIDVLG
jgi:hypothetical protein